MNAVNANTAIGTTATADIALKTMAQTRTRVGRFAPSPTGGLHLGSLTTAVASFLDARQAGGRWLLRIEDLDQPRIVAGAADLIQRTLESLGLMWDGPVVYQSRRQSLYLDALSVLTRQGLLYPCSCTRRDRGATDDAGGYPGTCRPKPMPAAIANQDQTQPTAIRFRADLCPPPGPLEDRLFDRHDPRCADATASGDPIVRRKDGLYAYQLAVVVDDAEQGVTDVVRGADLWPSLLWQRSLQRALGVPPILRYAHLPLVCEADGAKLSKSKRLIAAEAPGPSREPASELLWRVLTLLRQSPPSALNGAPIAEVSAWAIANWRLHTLRGVTSLRADC